MDAFKTNQDERKANKMDKKKILEMLGDLAESLGSVSYWVDELDGDMSSAQSGFEDDMDYTTDQGETELGKAIDAIDGFRSALDDIKDEIDRLQEIAEKLADEEEEGKGGEKCIPSSK